MAEWSIAPVLKTGNGQPFVSSNLTASAIFSDVGYWLSNVIDRHNLLSPVISSYSDNLGSPISARANTLDRPEIAGGLYFLMEYRKKIVSAVDVNPFFLHSIWFYIVAVRQKFLLISFKLP